MKNEGYLNSELSIVLGKGRRTIKNTCQAIKNDLCKHIRKRYNPYENRVINLVEEGYIEK